MSAPVALIAGGTRGIGLAIARRLAADGHDLALLHLDDVEQAERARAELAVDGRQILVLKADVANNRELRKAFKAFDATFSRLDVVVFAAGEIHQADLEDIELAAWQRAIDVGVQGLLEVGQLIHPRMKENGGSVLLLSSVAASVAHPGLGALGVPLAAVESLGRYMATEWREDGIRVNTLCLGAVDTRQTRKLAGVNQLIAESGALSGAIATPDQVAEVARTVLGSGMGLVTGQVIRADSGMTLGIDFEAWALESEAARELRASGAVSRTRTGDRIEG